MLTNEQFIDLLKANITTALGGQASAQDANEFIDLAVEQTQVLGKIRVETGIKTSMNLDSIELGEPAMVAGTEGTAPVSGDIVTPTINRKSLQPVEVLNAFNVSFSFLRQNIEGQRVNETLNRIFAKRFGKDTVLVAFNGDTDNAGTSRTDKALQCLDGYYKQFASDSNIHEYTVASTDYLKSVFPGMLEELPKDYKDDREMLGLFVSPDVAEAYGQQVGLRETVFGDQVMTTLVYPRFRGIEIIPVYGNDDSQMILTPKKNLAIGYGLEMTIGRDIYYRTRLIEVTITAEFDAKYAVSDAIVYGHA